MPANLAYDNTAVFTRTERTGKLVLLGSGLLSKALSGPNNNSANHTVAPQTDTFWADRHSPNSTASDTTGRSRAGAQTTSVTKKTPVARPDSSDFWGQRHST